MDGDTINTLDARQLGERLKEARRASGLTQEAVASRLDILRTTLVAIEKGDRRVTPGELIKLASIFGKPVSEFVSRRVIMWKWRRCTALSCARDSPLLTRWMCRA